MNDNLMKKEKWKKGKCELEILCKTCGEPVTIFTNYGWFCKHKHGQKEAKAETKAMEKIVRKMCKTFKW